MANQEHLDLLKQRVDVWNRWRVEHGDIKPDFSHAQLNNANLSGADLSGAEFSYAQLIRADFIRANLRRANLGRADFSYAHLSGADLSGAALSGADFSKADLSNVNLTGADLGETNLTGAHLSNADLSKTRMGGTTIGNVDLQTVKGLDTVTHFGPSTMGIDTIMHSEGNIPEVFLRGVGISDTFITYIRSLVGKPIEYYSCFISYSSKDQEFVERLYVDLQGRGVRCWFAPEDLKIGDKIRDRIDQSIRVHDKLLVVLSEHSVKSSWVEFEVEAAFAKESSKNALMLFPIRLDDAVKESPSSWAAHIRRTRNIGNFSNWKQHDDYQKALNRLVRDLKPETHQ